MSVERMRAYDEAPWLSLLPDDARAALERVEADPEAEEWAALVATDRALEDGRSRPSRSARLLVPLAVGGLLAAILLALDPAGVADRGRAAGGSTATASGEVAALTEVTERNRLALASSASQAATGVAAATRPGKPGAGGGGQSGPGKPSAGGGGGGSQTSPPGTTPPPGSQISVPTIQVPSVEVPPISVPPVVPGVQLPPVELPPVSLPPVQLPPLQVPQLSPLLPPSGQ
jgi:hypothetical protein